MDSVTGHMTVREFVAVLMTLDQDATLDVWSDYYGGCTLYQENLERGQQLLCCSDAVRRPRITCLEPGADPRSCYSVDRRKYVIGPGEAVNRCGAPEPILRLSKPIKGERNARTTE